MNNMSKEMKLYEVLNWASLFLEKNNCEPKVADILLQHHLQITATEFYLLMHEPVSEEIVERLKKDVQAHVQTGIPVQHLTGYEYFYGRKFYVNEHVLIPRPETEELVQRVINDIQTDKQHNIKIVDIGTGSGVIAITLALELPDVHVYATDISEEALKMANKNAQYHKATVTFLQGNFLQPLIDQQLTVDYIIANPPYIKQTDKDSLSRTVKNFDPALALFAGEDGLDAYRNIISMIPKISESHSKVFFEIGHDQGEEVSQLLSDQFPNSHIQVIKDINGKDRIVCAQL